MSWFNDLGTTKKLFLCFGFLAAMLAGVGYVGITAVAETNASVDTAYNRDLKGVMLAMHADMERLVIAKNYRTGLLANDPAGREHALRSLDDSERTFATTLNELQASLILQDNITRVEETKRMTVDYLRLAREAIRASASDHQRAMVLLEEATAVGMKIGAEIDALLATKFQLTKREQEKSQERYMHSRNVVGGSTIVAMFFAFVCAMVVGRAIAIPLKDSVQVLETVAQGDLTVRLKHQSKDEIGKLAVALNASLESIQSTLANAQSISIEVSAAATQMAASAQQISSGAQEQAASLEETAASLEEISSTVKQNTDNAQQASQLANGARDAAEHGGQVVESAVAAMNEITKSSKKIADIITTIDEIAFQTNLLALNAAVEAARAGEQGRGFGVVAAEVRSLAQRTATAAKEIRGLIADSSSKVEAGTFQVNQSGETLEDIVKSVKRVTDMVAEIAAASREQTTGIEQVNTAVTQVDQVTQLNAAQTEELSATAISLSDKANDLRERIARFELGTEPPARALTKPTAPAAGKKVAYLHAARPAAQAAPKLGKVANGYEEF